MTMTYEKLRKLHPAVWLSIVTVGLLALFLNKPYDIDDPLFIWTARHIQANPMGDFYGFQVNWYGSGVPMSTVQQNPPLLAYYLALIGNFFGWSEWVLHTAMLFPALLVVVGTWRLAREFVQRPWLAALATLFTPAVMVSSTTVMCDIMMLGFWIWAVIFWMEGLKKNDGAKFFIAGLLIALSSLTKYYGIAAIPLLLVYSLVKTRRLGRWALYFLVPLVVLAAYQWVTARLYGHGLLSNAASYANVYRSEDVFGQVAVGLVFVGGAVVMVAFYAPLLWTWRQGLVLLGLWVGIMVMAYFRERFGMIPLDYDAGRRPGVIVQQAVFALAGIHLLALAIVSFRSRRNADTLLLLLWIVGALVFSVLVNWTINVRSLLPIAPAIAIFLVARLEQLKCDPKKMGLLLVPGALIALGATWAEYDYSVLGRKAAETLCQTYGGNKLWFQGHWGFQYYMQEGGAREIDFERTKLTKGQLIISPNHNTNLQKMTEAARAIRMMEFFPEAIMAVNSPMCGASFYSSTTGPLPFAFGRGETEPYFVQALVGDLNLAGTDCVNHIIRGNRYWESGDQKGGMEDYRAALLYGADVPPNGLAMIAWIMATVPDASLRDGPQAVALAQRATRLTHLQNARFLDVLAAAYAESGRMSEAVLMGRAAVATAEAQGQGELAALLREHLQAFELGRPFRDLSNVPAKK